MTKRGHKSCSSMREMTCPCSVHGGQIKIKFSGYMYMSSSTGYSLVWQIFLLLFKLETCSSPRARFP